MPSDKPLMSLSERDLKGSLYRLNRRFELIEQQQATTVETLASLVKPPGNPVDITDLNRPPGKTNPVPPASPAITYGPHDLRIGSYVADYHKGELFVETDRGNTVYQSQLVADQYQWVLVP